MGNRTMNEIDLARPPTSKRLSRIRGKRGLLGSLAGVAICLVMMGLFLLHYSDRELREAIAEADRLDPGWRTEELEAKRARIPEKENSALVLLEAQRLLPSNWPFWNFPGSPEYRNASKRGLQLSKVSLWSLEPPVLLDDPQIQALREELQRAEKSLNIARRVIGMPRGRYPEPITISSLRLGRLLAYDVLMRSQDQDIEGALASCQGILNCPFEWR
jgi:hypothetical protein